MVPIFPFDLYDFFFRNVFLKTAIMSQIFNDFLSSSSICKIASFNSCVYINNAPTPLKVIEIIARSQFSRSICNALQIGLISVYTPFTFVILLAHCSCADLLPQKTNGFQLWLAFYFRNNLPSQWAGYNQESLLFFIWSRNSTHSLASAKVSIDATTRRRYFNEILKSAFDSLKLASSHTNRKFCNIRRAGRGRAAARLVVLLLRLQQFWSISLCPLKADQFMIEWIQKM